MALTSRLRPLALSPLVWLVVSGTVGCEEESQDYPRLYVTSDRAPSLPAAEIAALDHLGAIPIDQGTNFGVFSANAERIDLLLFDDPESERPTRQFPMVRFGDVFNLHVGGIGYGQHYGFVAWGPNWPFDPTWYPGSAYGFLADVDAGGNRFNPNKLLFDPYARGFHRDHDWSKGSLASGPMRANTTYAAAAKSVVTKSSYGWSASEAAWRQARQDASMPGHRRQDLIVYEVHLKGFTADEVSGVDHPGTYRGFGEKAAYLADLGITAVELMPVHEKPLDGGYWGYQTIGFFAPELSYAFDKRPGKVIDEFKWMVDQLHQQGIEVLLDVVYNHTGEGGLWREKIALDDVSLDPFGADSQYRIFDPKETAGLYSFRGLDNASYYALSPDNQTYWNDTGVGNQTRCNNAPMYRLVLDSLRYWVDEMHVDGFRFDLAPVLGRSDNDPSLWLDPSQTLVQAIIDDPVLRKYNTRIIAEPWAAGGNPSFNLGGFPAATAGNGDGWYEWNANFRDVWRSFVNQDGYPLNGVEGAVDIGGALTGSSPLFDWNGRRSYHSVNFISVHDGFTLYDLFSYDLKQNGCGPLNPVCCDGTSSPFCDLDSGENNNRSRNWLDEPTKYRLMRNMFVAILSAHGTPMIYGGDEWARTQLGNNNAYSSGADNPYNWFAWGTWVANDDRHRLHDFVRGTIALRKRFAEALAPASYGGGAAFDWKNAANQPMAAADWGTRHVAQHYYGTTGPQLLLLFNMETSWVDFTLPTGVTWVRLVDTQEYFDSPEYRALAGLDARSSGNVSLDNPPLVQTPTYNTAPRSIVVLASQP